MMFGCLNDRIVQRNISQIVRTPFSGVLPRSGVFFLVRKQFKLECKLICVGTNHPHCLKKLTTKPFSFAASYNKSKTDLCRGNYCLSD